MDKVNKGIKGITTQKRERSVNFTHEETELLVSLAEAKKYIIENKKSDATTWQDKERAWLSIEKAFNSSCGSVYRDHKHLKLKYEAIKRDTRKKSALVRAELYRTGGGPNTAPVLTPVEQKVKEMILISVEGNESYYDSDRTLPNVAATSIWTPPQGYSSTQEKSQAAEELLDDTIVYEANVLEGGDTGHDDESPTKKPCKVPVTQEGGHQQCEKDNTSPIQAQGQPAKWKDWNPRALKSKKHPALSKPKEKRPFEILMEEKIEIAQLQKKLITEEMEHKRVMWELEKKHMLLKINLLEKEINK